MNLQVQQQPAQEEPEPEVPEVPISEASDVEREKLGKVCRVKGLAFGDSGLRYVELKGA